MLEHSQDLLIDNIKRQTLDLNRERATLISDVKAFVNSTHERNRRSVIFFAMGAAAALALELIVKKTACKLLPIFRLCHDSEYKMSEIKTQLHQNKHTLLNLSGSNKSAVHILADEKSRRQRNIAEVLIYTSGNFEMLERAVDHLRRDMEEAKRAQVCNHKRSDVFTFFFKTQNVLNNVFFSLLSVQSYKSCVEGIQQ